MAWAARARNGCLLRRALSTADPPGSRGRLTSGTVPGDRLARPEARLSRCVREGFVCAVAMAPGARERSRAAAGSHVDGGRDRQHEAFMTAAHRHATRGAIVLAKPAVTRHGRRADLGSRWRRAC